MVGCKYLLLFFFILPMVVKYNYYINFNNAGRRAAPRGCLFIEVLINV